MSYLSDCKTFFREFRRQFRNTGSVLPSSRFLGRAMASPLRQPRQPAQILEVGPGTGSVTREILRQLQQHDRLDAVEINEYLYARLEQRFAEEPLFQQHREQVRLINSPVEDVPGEGVYDFIISGLPLNNFPVDLVRKIFRVFTRLLKPGGTLTYFEYLLIRQLKTPFVNRAERRRLGQIGRVVDTYINKYQFSRERIFINVPPAVVRHLRLGQ